MRRVDQFVEGPLAGMKGIFTQQDGEKRAIGALSRIGFAHGDRNGRHPGAKGSKLIGYEKCGHTHPGVVPA